VVLGLPRGGVEVAVEVAAALAVPLDVIMVRKLGVPSQPELAMGAIGEGGVRIVLPETVRRAGVTPDELAEVELRERAELQRRAQRFRGDRPRIPLAGRTAVVVDDGIATGSTARAWVARMHDAADELVALVTPAALQAIGTWYTDFTQTTDEQVVACLRGAVTPMRTATPSNGSRDSASFSD
jgi:putative phosphoribosyl transferase